MKIKKKQMIVIGAALAVVVAAGVAFAVVRSGGSSGGKSEHSVYVDSVADLCGLGSGNGLTDRFSGIVEPQKTWEIKLPSDKKVDEILVKEGDEVKTGDKLFTYNVEEMEENLAQAEIDLDRLANEIEQTKEQIVSLKKEKASASSDMQLGYTTQINTAENEIKRKEYEQKSKKVEIEKLKNSIANATVTSEMDGVVKSIQEDSQDSGDMGGMTGESGEFMTILATGSFRIKGTVNEQNMSAVIEGQSVLVHSRVNEDVWRGTMTAVDLENPEKNENNYYVSSDSMDNSTNYPFYVELENADGLMLGQHVYIEMDYGQEEKREGIWLDSYYIVQEDEKAYVWAANSKDRMEKREVTLGEFDEELQKYQITDGLTEEDYIAFPDETIEVGNQAVKNVDQAGEMENMGGMDGGDIPEFDEPGEMEGVSGMDGGESLPEGGDEEMPDDAMGFEEDEEEEGIDSMPSVSGKISGEMEGME